MQYSENYKFKLPESTDPVEVSDLSENFAHIDSLVKEASQGGAQIATGSYTGSGTYNAANKNSLTFPFVPKFVAVLGAGTYSSGQGATGTDGRIWTGQNGTPGYWALSGHTLTWYDSDARNQLNRSGVRYYYVGIG